MNDNQTSTTTNPEPQRVYEFAYPFIKEPYSDIDEEGWHERLAWRPGCRHEQIDHGQEYQSEADGIGQQILTVVSTHKPPGFPERVFYTRQWRDPSGKIFGKNRLFIRSRAQFTALTRGYRHEFELSKVPATPPPSGPLPGGNRLLIGGAE